MRLAGQHSFSFWEKAWEFLLLLVWVWIMRLLQGDWTALNTGPLLGGCIPIRHLKLNVSKHLVVKSVNALKIVESREEILQSGDKL